MKLLDTIPIYEVPVWIQAALCALIFLTLLCVGLAEKRNMPDLLMSIAIISFVLALICSILIATGVVKYHDHDEYVIELTDMPAYKLFLDYELVQTYEYSNAWRIRKRVGTK